MRLFDSKDQLEELQYDVDDAIPDINEWRAHILRKAHQDTVKTAVVEKPANNQVLIIMDWSTWLPRNRERMVREKGQVVARFCRCQNGRRRPSWGRVLSPGLEILKHTRVTQDDSCTLH